MHFIIGRNWYKFFLLAVAAPTEATKNLFQFRYIF